MNFDFELPPLTNRQRRMLRGSIGTLITIFTTALSVANGALYSLAMYTTGWRFVVFSMTLGVLSLLELALLGLFVATFRLTSLREPS